MKNFLYTILFSFLWVSISIGQNAPENVDVGVFEPGTYNLTPPANATLEVAIKPDMVFPANPAAANLNFILRVPENLVDGGEVYTITADNLTNGDMIFQSADFLHAGDLYVVFVYNGGGVVLSGFPANTWTHAFTIHIANLNAGTAASDFTISDSSTPLFNDFGGYRTSLDVLMYNEFLPLSSNPGLPLDLISFNAEKYSDQKSSLLKWVTVNEINTGNFVIQRSTNKINWVSVGSVKAAGNSLNVENYSFIDYNVYNGTTSRLKVYYRLLMVDLDGRTEVSPIQSVTFGNDTRSADELSVVVYPNPASDGVQVEWEATNDLQPTLLELYDVTGKLVMQQKVTENTNQQYIDFGPAKIYAGVYLLRILNGTDPIDHQQIVVGQSR